jgi:hypothetical protein
MHVSTSLSGRPVRIRFAGRDHNSVLPAPMQSSPTPSCKSPIFADVVFLTAKSTQVPMNRALSVVIAMHMKSATQ